MFQVDFETNVKDTYLHKDKEFTMDSQTVLGGSYVGGMGRVQMVINYKSIVPGDQK